MHAMFLTVMAALAAPPVTASDLQKLQGTWVGVSSEQDGRKVPEEQARALLLIFRDNGLTVRHGDETLEHSAVALHWERRPKAIDVTPSDGDNRGQTLLGIYEIEGNTLKICIGDVGRQRPTEFAAKEGTGITLYVLRREGR
jgi:uncharacterized protein (TIGR03067 family)